MDIKSIKAVLFDMDGTLLDTRPSISMCLNETRNFFGFPEYDIGKYLNDFSGGPKEVFQETSPEYISEELKKKVLTRYIENYIDFGYKYSTVYSGIDELIDFLRSRGLILCVLSNNNENSATLSIQHFFGNDTFPYIWADNNTLPLKPKPDMGLMACDKLCLPAENVLYIGDSIKDIQFAKAAGMISAGACWGFTGGEGLKDTGAEMLLRTPMDLCEIIESLSNK